ncbi:MAG: YggT family protein [Pseudomonadota bacterium]
MQAILYLVDLVGKVIVGVFLLRFFLQLTRASFYNPVSKAVVSFTNPLVMPLRKVIPGWGGVDNASLLAAYLAQIGVIVATYALLGGLQRFSIVSLLIQGLLSLILAAISLYTILIFFSVLLSWFNRDPGNPLAMVIGSLTEPVLRPARRLIPPIAGLDLSPLIVLVALQVLNILVTTELAPRLT